MVQVLKNWKCKFSRLSPQLLHWKETICTSFQEVKPVGNNVIPTLTKNWLKTSEDGHTSDLKQFSCTWNAFLQVSLRGWKRYSLVLPQHLTYNQLRICKRKLSVAVEKKAISSHPLSYSKPYFPKATQYGKQEMSRDHITHSPLLLVPKDVPKSWWRLALFPYCYRDQSIHKNEIK